MTDDLAAENARLRTELAKLREAGVTRPPDGPMFFRQDIADAAFFHAHKAEILAAAARGRIIDDPSRGDWRVKGASSQAEREARRKGTR